MPQGDLVTFTEIFPALFEYWISLKLLKITSVLAKTCHKNKNWQISHFQIFTGSHKMSGSDTFFGYHAGLS